MGVRVREKSKGSNEWWVFINHAGRRTSRKVGTKRMALEAARVIGANLILDKPAFQEKKLPVPKLGEYYQSRLKPYMKLTLKRSTYITFESSFRVHILPQFGPFHLDQIDRQKMEGFISKLVKKDMAKDSIRLILAALSCLYTHAGENNVVTENPAKGVSKLYKQVPSRHKKPEPLTVEESLAFLSAAQHDPEHYPIFLIALHSGLRSGEIGGLQWGDIDWRGRSISIRRNIVRGRVTTLKTESSERTVDCSDDLLRVLADLRRSRQEQALKSGSKLCPWVFTCRKGQPIGMNNVKARYFKRAIRKAGLRDFRFHDLRHTYASLLLAQGEPLTYVANQLGHANPGITLKIYARWIPKESQREAVNKLPSLSRQLEVRSAKAL